MNIETITPRVTVNPRRMYVFFVALGESLDDNKERYPGYNGRTHTAKIGADSPAMNDSQKFSNADMFHLLINYNLSSPLSSLDDLTPDFSNLAFLFSSIITTGAEGALATPNPNSSIRDCVTSFGATA